MKLAKYVAFSLSLFLIQSLALAQASLTRDRAQFPRSAFVTGNIVVRRVGIPIENRDGNGNPIVKDTFCFRDLSGKKVRELELRRSLLGSPFAGAGGLWDEADLTQFTSGKSGRTYHRRDPLSPGEYAFTEKTYTDHTSYIS
ncbi:MAG: hypothetical protein K2X47_15810, partial [Bdellovibrionales bacterium]|nr:hypothetical protein [Bdellovibrionales bacterium]